MEPHPPAHNASPRRRHRQRLTPAVIARRQRELRALELRTQGYTLEQIAQKLGLANRGVASKYIARILARNESESVEEMRQIMGAQLETIVTVLWPLITRPRPSLAAIDRLLKIHDRQVKLFGLDPGCSCEKNRRAQSNVMPPPPDHGYPARF